MGEPERTAAVTGAGGYLGSLTCSALEVAGLGCVRLTRDPKGPSDRRYSLAAPIAPGLLDGIDVLVHAAYDMAVTSRQDIWRVNVEGSRRLLEAAHKSGVDRVVFVSSMSAYEGTSQLYGQAKLEIEAMTSAVGGCVLRPGLVYGSHPGGMVGALLELTRQPIVPVIGGDASVYPVHEDDVVAAVVAAAVIGTVPTGPIGVAPPTRLSFREIMKALAASEGRTCRFLPIPWQAPYWALRFGETLGVALPFRADSLLGLVRPAPTVPGRAGLLELGIDPREFAFGRTSDSR